MYYVPLHLHSWYSMLEGVEPPERLLERAACWGYRAIALTDTNGLYGAVVFREAAARCGLRPIFGATLELAGQRCVALVRDRSGYANLCRTISAIHEASQRGRIRPTSSMGSPRPTCPAGQGGSLAELILPRADGLIFLTADLELAEVLCRQLGTQYVRLELTRPGPRQHEWQLWQLHQRLRVLVVAATNAHLLDEAGYRRFETVSAIRCNSLIERVRAELAAVLEQFHSRVPVPPHYAFRLLPPGAIERLYADVPVTIRNAAAVAEQCEPDVLPRGPFIPQARLPAGRSAQQHLEGLCRAGLNRRYGQRPEQFERATQQLQRELAIIAARDLAHYFLVVCEIVMYSRRQGLPVALRGSGGSSIIAYLIGITDVDPLQYGLTMERFLHERREDLPDLDIDFCWRVRDRVIEHVFRRFGRERTAMISSHITLQPRSAFREVAKAYGLSDEEVSRLQERLPRSVRNWFEHGGDGPELAELHADGSGGNGRVDLNRLLDEAKAICGAPHHLSVHPGGVVITPEPIDQYVPVQWSEKGVRITQLEKDGAEAIGLVKFDLLGNRSLSTVAEAVRRVSETEGARGGRSTKLQPVSARAAEWRPPPEDPKTADLVCSGRTLGVGQLESPAMRNLLVMLQARSLYELMQALALIRPGAASIGCKEQFVRRRRGLEPVRYSHPALEPVLRDTCGLMLYEDDAIHVVAALTGMDLAEADQLRKAITKCRSDEERRYWSEQFLRRAVANGVPAGAAREQWVHLAKFNAYSFCKSHAASYAQLAWSAAYLKAHYPLQFWVAALNNNQGMYEPRVYIEEIKRADIAVLPPCINRSADEFSIDADPPEFRRGQGLKDIWRLPGDFWLPLWSHDRAGRAGEPAIRVGLSQIAGLSVTTRERILECRPLKSLEDFVNRIPVGPEELALLVRAGAFDFSGRPRPQLLLEARVLARRRLRRAARPGGMGRGLFEESAGELPSSRFKEQVRLGDYSLLRRVRDELELFGFTLGPHLMSFYRPFLPGELSDSRQIAARVGDRIELAGLVAAAKHVVTGRGGLMQFITFEDEHGLFEVAVFPDMARELEHLRLGPYLITGQVEERLGDITIRAVGLELLEGLQLERGWQRLAERQCTRLKPICSVPPRIRLTGRVAA